MNTNLTDFFLYYKIEGRGRSLVSGNIWGTKPGRSFCFDLETHKFFDFAEPSHSGIGIKQLFALRNEPLPEVFRATYQKLSRRSFDPEKKESKDKVYIKRVEVIPHYLTPPNKLSFWDTKGQRIDIPAKAYTYKDALGQRVGFIMRGVDADTKQKVIRPLSVWLRLLPSGKTIHSYRQKKFVPILYNLDLIETQLEKTIVVVEGEKCAEFGMRCATQYKIPLIFTTWPFGAQSYHTDPIIWSVLKDRKRVVLWPDNDDVGKKTMHDIKSRFVPHALIVKPEKIGLREKEDIADLPLGKSLELLLKNLHA